MAWRIRARWWKKRASSIRKAANRRAHRPLRRGIHAARRPGDDAMQRRRAGDRRNRHGARRDSRGRRAGQKTGRPRAGNAAVSCRARGSPRGNCIRTAFPLTLITDNMVGHFLKTGGDRLRGGGRRPHRRQRRHRQQDRDLSDRRAGAAKTTSRFMWPRRFPRSICRSRPATRFPSRSAPPPR